MSATLTEMSVYTGSAWRVSYGEISERLMFRIGLVGNAAYQAVFPIGQLTDLIGILQGTANSAVGQLVYGVELQGKRVSDGFRNQISIEPRSDQFPPPITLVQDADRADLLATLQQLQADLPNAVPEDWDYSRIQLFASLNNAGKVPDTQLPDRLAEETIETTIVDIVGENGSSIVGTALAAPGPGQTAVGTLIETLPPSAAVAVFYDQVEDIASGKWKP